MAPTSDSLGRTLTQLAAEHPHQELVLDLGRSAEEIVEQGTASRHRAAAGRDAERADRPVDVAHRQGRRERSGGQVTQARPTDPDATLAHPAGEEADDGRNLVGIGGAEHRSETRRLLATLAGCRDVA